MTRAPVDPVIEHFVKDLLARKRPDRPWMSGKLDEMAAGLVENPHLFYESAKRAKYMEAMLLTGGKIREMIAEKLQDPELRDDRYLQVQLEEDWQINAEVERQPPYHVYVSTNLYRFCARLSELLTGGLAITLTDDDGKEQPPALPPFSRAEVVSKTREILDNFIHDRTIPGEDASLTLAHTSIRDLTFYSIMASIVGHEFAHVVINEERRTGKTDSHKPYAKFARGLLGSHAQKLLYTPMHDPDDRVGLAKLDQREVREVGERWIDELTADLIGVDLARAYHKDFGPARGKPGVVAFTNSAIHLGFIAQVFLYVYLNHRDPDFPLTSRTHPPIDFRLHCVVNWIYENPQHPSVMTFINYCQDILKGVLAETN